MGKQEIMMKNACKSVQFRYMMQDILLVKFKILSWMLCYLSRLTQVKQVTAHTYVLLQNKYDGILEQNRTVQLEGNYKDHRVRLPGHFGANKNLKHDMKGIIQTPLEY